MTKKQNQEDNNIDVADIQHACVKTHNNVEGNNPIKIFQRNKIRVALPNSK